MMVLPDGPALLTMAAAGPTAAMIVAVHSVTLVAIVIMARLILVIGIAHLRERGCGNAKCAGDQNGRGYFRDVHVILLVDAPA